MGRGVGGGELIKFSFFSPWRKKSSSFFHAVGCACDDNIFNCVGGFVFNVSILATRWFGTVAIAARTILFRALLYV